MDQRLVTSWVVGLFDGAEDFGDGPFFMVIFWQWWQGSWALWLGFHRWFLNCSHRIGNRVNFHEDIIRKMEREQRPIPTIQPKNIFHLQRLILTSKRALYKRSQTTIRHPIIIPKIQVTTSPCYPLDSLVKHLTPYLHSFPSPRARKFITISRI